MFNITSNIEEIRSVNGGDWHCRVCGHSSPSFGTMFTHAAGHVGKAYLKILGIVSIFVK